MPVFHYFSCDSREEYVTDTCARTNISFGFRRYNAYQGEGQKSGAYIFRPQEEKSYPYWNITSPLLVYNGTVMQMIEFKGEEGVVRASFAWGDRHGIDFEANLFGLPLSANGTEATFNI